MRCCTVGALAWLATVLGACSDGVRSPAEPASIPEPVPTAPSLVRLNAEVDLVRGTMRFSRPVSGGIGESDARFALYGDQYSNVRVYNSPVTIVDPSRAGFKTYTGNVGLQNLLSYPIGDEQGGPTPADTNGIFLVFVAGPTVASPSPCAGCTVTITNPQGVGTFDLPNRSYFYWPDRLSARNGGSDTTSTRRAFVFEASTEVTNFNFEVLVSAAWPAPHDSIWRVEYHGDSMPDTQAEPNWRWLVPGNGTSTPSGGLLSVAAGSGQQNIWYRSDSLTSSSHAFVEARFYRSSGANNASPKGIVAIDDDTRLIAVGIGGSQAGFVNNTYMSFLAGGAVTVGTTAPHIFQLRKFGSDSVQLWVDGAHQLTRAYTAFDASTATTQPISVGFGAAPQNGGSVLIFDYVLYHTGRATP